MINNYIKSLTVSILCLSSFFVFSKNDIKSFQLDNGLKVFIWEDSTQNDVHGRITVKAGSKNDPEEYTGLAHYLEHLLFKGTDQIGTFDWEKEKPIYEKIIAKYDERATATTPEQKKAIDKEINQLTIEETNYSHSNEFSSLVAEMGGTGLNANTSYDRTTYFNDFPANQTEKFLTLYADRLKNPVFRTFQYELETVYEEYNMYADMLQQKESEFLFANLFAGHPYERQIIGLSEHLKNPRISKLIEFYNTWYVPNNMALFLVGKVKAEEVMPIIEKTFGTLAAKELPATKSYTDWNVTGRKEMKAKLAYTPHMYIAFNAVPQNHPDAAKLEVLCSVLSNGSNTGLFDKLALDGDLMAVGAETVLLTDQGRLILVAIPSYDPNQRVWGSFKTAEKMLLEDVDKVKNGDISATLLENIKNEIIRSYTLAFESDNSMKASYMTEYYASNLSLEDFENYADRISAITINDIQEMTKKYCNDNSIVFIIDEGKLPKAEKLDKPEIEPIKQAVDRKSDYAKLFEAMPYEHIALKVNDFSDVQIKAINTRSKLFYTENPENDVFSLILKYGIGTEKMPYVEYSVELMNYAGIMGGYDPQEFKKALTDLNITCRYSADEDYVYVIMEGDENHLLDALNLISRQILMPRLDQKQFDNIQGAVLQSRFTETINPSLTANAFSEYLLYQDKSSYLDRPTVTDIFYNMGISKLTGEFQRATDYEAEVHYCGKKSFDEVYTILSSHLPLKAVEKETTSPEIKPFAKYDNNTIYFLPNSETKQAKIYFFAEGNAYDPKNDFMYKALNNYLGAGGLTSLIFEEIREKNAMAYTAYGILSTPEIVGKPVSFHGYIGTQSDKVINAITLYMKLINDMPILQDRENTLKSYLELAPFTSQPSFRNMSQRFEYWKRLGYQVNPSLSQTEATKDFNMAQMLAFYQQELKGKPMGIAIIGDPKLIDLKALKAFGTVKKISSSSLFSPIE